METVAWLQRWSQSSRCRYTPVEVEMTLYIYIRIQVRVAISKTSKLRQGEVYNEDRLSRPTQLTSFKKKI